MTNVPLERENQLKPIKSSKYGCSPVNPYPFSGNAGVVSNPAAFVGLHAKAAPRLSSWGGLLKHLPVAQAAASSFPLSISCGISPSESVLTASVSSGVSVSGASATAASGSAASGVSGASGSSSGCCAGMS